MYELQVVVGWCEVKRTTNKRNKHTFVDDDDARTVHTQPRASLFPFVYIFISVMIFMLRTVYILLLFCINQHPAVQSVAKKDDDATSITVVAVVCYLLLLHALRSLFSFIHL